MKRIGFPLIVVMMLSSLVAPANAQTTDESGAWRALAEKLEAGTAIDMRLRDGKHFKATFIAAHQDTMLLQRKTRIPVPVEEIDYESIATLSRVQPSMSGGKVAGIALGSAGAAVGALFLILLASLD